MKKFTIIIVSLALAAAVAGCRPETQESESGGGQAGPAGLAAVVTDETLDGALSAAKEDGKPVMAIFSAPSWCSWCQKLDKETLTDAKVQEELKGLHVVFVDYDKEKELVSKYQISGVPMTILFDSSGKKIHDIIGFRKATDFLEEVKTGLAKAV